LKFNPHINHISIHTSDHHRPNELGPRLILIPSSFSPKPLIYFTCDVSYQTRHTKFIIHVKHAPHSIIYMFLIIQFTPKPITIIQTAHCLAQSLAQAGESRSGETCSLRRASPSPRRGFDGALMELHGISLRRDPSRLGEVFPRSKLRAGRLGDLSCNNPRRAPCFISPRRDGLAWARLTGLATVLHCSSHGYRTKQAYKASSHTKSTD